MLSHTFAETKCMTEPPSSMPEMLDALFMGFDRDSLTHSKQLQHSNRAALDAISQKLQVGCLEAVTSTSLCMTITSTRLRH